MISKPFAIAVPDADLADLRHRLARVRWPDEVNDSESSYGLSMATLRPLIEYWADGFDWRAQETALNRLPQFRGEVGGLNLHFVHQRGAGPRPFPLILTHGWPGSFIEMRRILPLLADPAAHGGNPADAFDVIIPSLPGYGFSDRPTAPGMSPAAIATLWGSLMEGLGYSRYGVQGGDWGSAVSMRTALAFPDAVAGMHLNFLPSLLTPALGPNDSPLSPDEQAFLDGRSAWLDEEGGYSRIQGTKPQTLGYALTDSPVGLAAWILEKFRAWSDCGGDVESLFGRDDLLTNISIYWLTNTVASSLRIYRESRLDPLVLGAGERVATPMGYARFPHEISRPPREWLDRMFDVRRFTDMPRGGHFAAMEQPELLAEEIRAFFRPLR